MFYSVGCRYGIQALTRLASRAQAGRFCLLRDIVDDVDLPQHFVGKILQLLVRGDILTSAKGRGGGFALRRAPDQIRLRDIVEAIDGPNRRSCCFIGFEDCERHQPCEAHHRCAQLQTHIDELLDKTTLAMLIISVDEPGMKGRFAKKQLVARVNGEPARAEPI